MNYKIVSRVLAIAIVLGILYISMNIILPYYLPQTPSESGTHIYIGEIYSGIISHRHQVNLELTYI